MAQLKFSTSPFPGEGRGSLSQISSKDLSIMTPPTPARRDIYRESAWREWDVSLVANNFLEEATMKTSCRILYRRSFFLGQRSVENRIPQKHQNHHHHRILWHTLTPYQFHSFNISAQQRKQCIAHLSSSSSLASWALRLRLPPRPRCPP